MPRRRLTYEEALLHGSAHHNKKRFADRESSPSIDGPPLGPPLAEWGFGEAESWAWNEIRRASPYRLLQADMIALAVAAKLLAKWRHDELTAADWSRLRSWLGKFGIPI